MNTSIVRSKYKGSLLGTSVGDSIGALAEGNEGINKQSTLIYTDDTHMMIGVAESLINSHGFNPDNMIKLFIKNYESEPNRGYAAGPPHIFERIKHGADWKTVSNEMYQSGSYGNGSAMRIAPIGLYYNNNFFELNRVARESSEITHAHPLGQEGAAILGCAVGLASLLSPGAEFPRADFITKLSSFCTSEVFKAKLKTVEKFAGEMDQDSIVLELGNGVESFNSVPTAIYFFLANLTSFENAVMNAVSLGGDSDTLGAMTGAISGAYLGYQAIPEEWLNKLENRNYIETLAERLLATKIEVLRTGDYI